MSTICPVPNSANSSTAKAPNGARSFARRGSTSNDFDSERSPLRYQGATQSYRRNLIRLSVRAAVNGQCRAGDVLGLVACQERHGIGDVVDLAVAAQRHELAERVAERTVRRVHVGVDGARLPGSVRD